MLCHRLRANSGSFLAPNKTNTITRISTHSDGPGAPNASIFIILILSGIETRRHYQKLRRDHLRVLRRETKSALLVRPTTLSFTSPPLKKRRVGTLRIPNRLVRFGLLSTSTFVILTTSPCSFAISSNTRTIIRQGPHQAAEKSTKIGTGDSPIV